MEERMNQFKKVLEIINKTYDEDHFGIIYFTDVTLDQINEIKKQAPLFIEDWDVSWNDAPTAYELVKFVESNPEFTFEGFVTIPEEREGECRVTLTAVAAPETDANIAALYSWINDDKNEFIEPGELNTYNGNIRAWWD